MSKLKVIILTSLILFVTENSLAITIPNVVYRMDTRAPITNRYGDIGIFYSGFDSRGTNNNLLEHIEGGSDDSWFISTTAAARETDDFTRHLREYAQNTSDTVWVYEITPANDFFNVPISLEHIRDNEHNDAGWLAGELLNDHGWQNEWVAEGSILPSHIRRAFLYQRQNNSSFVVIETEDNDNYIETAPVAQTGPYMSLSSTIRDSLNLVNNELMYSFCNNGTMMERNKPKTVLSQEYDNGGTCANPLVVSFSDYKKIATETNWDAWKQSSCDGEYRSYKARLMNIPGSWELACQVAPVNVEGMPVILERKCENTWITGFLIHGEYGTFKIHDKTCKDPSIAKAHFETSNPSDSAEKVKCRPSGKLMEYKVKLWDISGSWEDACAKMPFVIKGQYFSQPNYCKNQGGLDGEYGHFYVSDNSCPK